MRSAAVTLAHDESAAHRPARRKRLAGWLLVVLVAATPLLAQVRPAALYDLARNVRQTPSGQKVENAVRPATRVASGNWNGLRNWVEHLSDSRLIVFTTVAIFFGVYVILRG